MVQRSSITYLSTVSGRRTVPEESARERESQWCALRYLSPENRLSNWCTSEREEKNVEILIEKTKTSSDTLQNLKRRKETILSVLGYPDNELPISIVRQHLKSMEYSGKTGPLMLFFMPGGEIKTRMFWAMSSYPLTRLSGG
jgi:hypothetical protein